MESVHPLKKIFQRNWQLLDRGYTGDIRLTSWGKFFTVQNLSFPTLFQ